MIIIPAETPVKEISSRYFDRRCRPASQNSIAPGNLEFWLVAVNGVSSNAGRLLFTQHCLRRGLLTVVDGCYQSVYGSCDDIVVDSCAPGQASVRFADTYIGDGAGA